ncbi:MAG: GIN domain-containing protein [Balneola sp.]
MEHSNTQSFITRLTSVLIKLTEPKDVRGFFANFVLALPRILAGFFLATMFGGDKFGVPWSIADTGLNLFEVVDWFPEDVAKFGFPFSKAPVFFAWIGAASEAIGGMFLLLGFQTRISGFLISCTMLTAIFLQKWGGPLWGMLPAMGFLWVSLYATAFGSGKFGLDYLITRKLKSGKLNTQSIKPASVISMILVVMAFGTQNSNAQIKGNGQIDTAKVEIESFTSIKNGLSSDIEIKLGSRTEIRVITDKNLFDLIDIEVIDGELDINQKEWISPTKQIRIEIITPELNGFANSAHGRFTASGINTELFEVMSPVGVVVLSGKAKELTVGTEVGTIDALNLDVEKARLNIWSWGTIKVNATNSIDADVSDNGKVVYAKEPEVLKTKTEKGGKVISLEEDKAPPKEVVYINVKIKNNSSERVNVEFNGPEGARFGYGAPFGRYQTRKERFPVGTEIYLVRPLWKDTLLLTIKEEDAGKTVNLFKD